MTFVKCSRGMSAESVSRISTTSRPGTLSKPTRSIRSRRNSKAWADQIVSIIVGLCTIELFLPDSQSLKDKRQVLLSVKDRLHQKFNLSVAEVDGQDLWQKAVLGLACVANDGRHVNQVLDQALNMIRSNPAVEIVQSRVELL